MVARTRLNITLYYIGCLLSLYDSYLFVVPLAVLLVFKPYPVNVENMVSS